MGGTRRSGRKRTRSGNQQGGVALEEQQLPTGDRRSVGEAPAAAGGRRNRGWVDLDKILDEVGPLQPSNRSIAAGEGPLGSAAVRGSPAAELAPSSTRPGVQTSSPMEDGEDEEGAATEDAAGNR